MIHNSYSHPVPDNGAAEDDDDSDTQSDSSVKAYFQEQIEMIKSTIAQKK